MRVWTESWNSQAAPAALGKDIICDRGSLLLLGRKTCASYDVPRTLLDFVSETLTPFLMKKGQAREWMRTLRKLEQRASIPLLWTSSRSPSRERPGDLRV